MVRSHIVGEGNETFYIRVWKPLSSERVLKILKGSSKRNTQREQYLLAVGLGCYIVFVFENFICFLIFIYNRFVLC